MDIDYDIEYLAQNLRGLRKYSDLDGTEIGEFCELLEAIEHRGQDCSLTDGFTKAIALEVKEQLKRFKEQTKIVERTSTSTTTYTELEWYE